MCVASWQENYRVTVLRDPGTEYAYQALFSDTEIYTKNRSSCAHSTTEQKKINFAFHD